LKSLIEKSQMRLHRILEIFKCDFLQEFKTSFVPKSLYINCLNSLYIVLACTVRQKTWTCFFLNHHQNVVFIEKSHTKFTKKSYFGSKRIFTKWPLLTVEWNKLQIVENWQKMFKILDFKIT